MPARSSQTASPVACSRSRKPAATHPWSSSTPAGAPTTPSRDTRRSRPSTTCTRHSSSPAATAASTYAGTPISVPARHRPEIASPFQAATTLSSRAGRTRRSRAARSRRCTSNQRSRSSGSSRSCRVEVPCSKVPASVTPSQRAAQGPSSGPERLGELRRRPDVVGALGALAVRVERGGEAALRRPQLAEQEVRDPLGGPDADRGVPPGVDPQQQRVVVEHLLEVRHHPVGVDAVAGEPAGELVVDPAAGHRLEGLRGHRERPLRALAEQELEHHRRRELRRAPEPAPDRVVLASQQVDGGVEGRPPDRGRGRRQRLAQVLPQPFGHALHLVAALAPRLRQRCQHLPEGRLPVPWLVGEVGAGEERPGVVVEHHGHRPAAVPGHRGGGVHVDRVDVGPLLAVDLDADEVLVHQRRRRVVLERLVGHDVAPVAGGVPDAQQHRHPPSPGLLERLRPPLPPVDGIVRVLEQVRRRGARESVRHRHHAIQRPAGARPASYGPSVAPVTHDRRCGAGATSTTTGASARP